MNQLELGVDLKAQGMEQAATSRYSALSFARKIARSIANSRPSRTVTIDDVQHRLLPEGIDLGNAAGSVFKEPCWQFLEYHRSHRASNHARIIAIWQLAA